MIISITENSYSMGSMKVHQFTRGLMSDHHIIHKNHFHHQQQQKPKQKHQKQNEPCLSLSDCKLLRPPAPKPAATTTAHHQDRHDNDVTTAASSIEHNSFLKPEIGPRIPHASSDHELKKDSPPQALEMHPGVTRWNPTQEQIGILEMLYRGGIRTPNAQQIEQIVRQLSRYGKIEGKNVFYWFQNHKARERQKQKRYGVGLPYRPRTPPTAATPSPAIINNARIDTVGEMLISTEANPRKRRCRSWAFECLHGVEEIKTCREEGDRTLELFPLRPEGK